MRKEKSIVYVLLVCVTVFVYAFIFKNPLLLWEPDFIRLLNEKPLWPGFFMPIPSLVVRLIQTVWPENPLAFRLFMTGVHLVTGLAVYRLIKAVFKKYLGRDEKVAAFWGSLFFLLTPIQMSSVGLVTGLPILLATLFLVLCLSFYLAEPFKATAARIFAVSGFFLAAILCHPVMLAAPFLIVLSDVIVSDRGRGFSGIAKRGLKALPLFVISIGAALYWLEPLGAMYDPAKLDAFAIPKNLIKISQLMIWPMGLAVDHGVGGDISWAFYSISLAVLVLFAWITYQWRQSARRVLVFALIMFFGFGLAQAFMIPTESLEEARAYLPAVFLSMALAFAWVEFAAMASTPMLKRLLVAVPTVVVFALLVMSVRRAETFSSITGICQEILDAHPRHKWAIGELASDALRRQDFAQAARYLEMLHAAAPEDTTVTMNLLSAIEKSDPTPNGASKRMALLVDASVKNPKDVQILGALADFYLANDLKMSAVPVLEKLAELSPGNLPLRKKVIQTLMSLNAYEKAKEQLVLASQAAANDPDFAKALKTVNERLAAEAAIARANAAKANAAQGANASTVAAAGTPNRAKSPNQTRPAPTPVPVPTPPPTPTPEPTPAGPETHELDCDSWSYAYQRCDVHAEILEAELIQQRSTTWSKGRGECVLNSTFGFEKDYFWVSGGCRGRFRIKILRNGK